MEALSLVLAVELWQLEGWLWPGLAVPSARLQRAVAMVDARELAPAAEVARGAGVGAAVALEALEDGEVDECDTARVRRELAELRARVSALGDALEAAHADTVRRRQSSRAGNK